MPLATTTYRHAEGKHASTVHTFVAMGMLSMSVLIVRTTRDIQQCVMTDSNSRTALEHTQR